MELPTRSALAVFMLIVTGVGLCIFVFATGYMHGETGLLSVLRLHGPLHVFDARAGDGLELPDDVCRLGRCRSLFVSADWLLLRSRRKRRTLRAKPSSRTASATLDFALAIFGIIATFGTAQYTEVFDAGGELSDRDCWAIGDSCPGSRSDSSSAPAESLHSFHCTCGCLTRWLVQHRSRR